MTTWIKNGDTGRAITFDAPPGLTSWNLYFSKNGGQGAVTNWATPSVTELSLANMPGVYRLAITNGAMVTMTASYFEEVVVFITAAGWSGKPLRYALYDPQGFGINVAYVNGIQLQGAGIPVTDPWRPV